jgi:hypothetical protein
VLVVPDDVKAGAVSAVFIDSDVETFCPEGFGDLCSVYVTRSDATGFAGGLNLNAMIIISTPTTNPKILSHSGGNPRNKNTITQTPSMIRNWRFDMWLV